MATQRETIGFILEKLRYRTRFSSRAMFGEYALYADDKVVGLVCDDTLYIKITPVTKTLEKVCEKGPPYPGAKPYYIIEETQLSTIEKLPDLLLALAATLPLKRRKK